MKWLAASLVVCLLPGCANHGTTNVAADSTAVMAALEEYRQGWLKGDTTAALRRVSDDIRIMIEGVPDIVGKDSTRKVFVAEMATYEVPVLTLNHQDVIVRGDHAIDIGTYDEIQIPKTGVPIHNRGRFMTIWRREGAPGAPPEWRIVRYMLN